MKILSFQAKSSIDRTEWKDFRSVKTPAADSLPIMFKSGIWKSASDCPRTLKIEQMKKNTFYSTAKKKNLSVSLLQNNNRWSFSKLFSNCSPKIEAWKFSIEKHWENIFCFCRLWFDNYQRRQIEVFVAKLRWNDSGHWNRETKAKGKVWRRKRFSFRERTYFSNSDRSKFHRTDPQHNLSFGSTRRFSSWKRKFPSELNVSSNFLSLPI